MHWSDEYPHMIYVSVLLLDNRIENWKVGNYQWHNPGECKCYWKFKRLKDYKVQSIGFWCKNDEEHNRVFTELAPKWLKQFKHAKDYRLSRAY
jgi:hypothetical protein